MKSYVKNLTRLIKENRVSVSVGVLLFIVAFFLRAWRLSFAPDIFGDEVVYTIIAQNLLTRGNLYWDAGYWFVHPPLHYIIMAFFFGLTKAPTLSLDAVYASRIVTCLIATLTIGVFFVFLRKFGSLRTAALTALLLVIEPYTMKFYRMAIIEPLEILLGALCLCFFYKALLADGKRDYILSGLFLGLALIAKDLAIFLLIVLAVFSYVSKRYLNQKFNLTGLRNLFVTAIAVYTPYLVWAFSTDAEGFISSKTTLLRRITGELWMGGYGDPRYRLLLVTDLIETFHIYVITYVLLFLSVIFCVYLFLKDRTRLSLFLASWWISVLLFFTAIFRIYNVQFFCYGIIPALLIDGYVFSKALSLDRLKSPKLKVKSKFNFDKTKMATVAVICLIAISAVYNLKVWYDFYGVGTDNCYRQAQDYIERTLPKGTRIACYASFGYLIPNYDVIQLDRFNTLESVKGLYIRYYVFSPRLTYFMEQALLDYIYTHGKIIATFYGHSLRQFDVYYIENPI